MSRVPLAHRLGLLCLLLGLSCSDVLGPGVPLEPRASEPTARAFDAGVEPPVRREPAVDAPEAKATPEARAVFEGTQEQPSGADAPAPSSAYKHIPSTLASVPSRLKGETWLRHFRDDILPYWIQAAAQGSPKGNFPTERRMDGSLGPNTSRRPRMLARQSFVYAMGFLMTGDVSLLTLAQKGCQWLMDKAWDRVHGGWHELLDAGGNPQGKGPKWAQDAAYSAMGPAACYFITRAAKYEKPLLETRDLLFDPSKYWDATHKRIKDGLDASLRHEQDQGSDGGWELVAQLDPINAFMLLVQPVLSRPERRRQMLADMQRLGQTLIDHFWRDGIFWGVHNLKGKYGSRHVDFGHTLKSYWMLLQVDKRLSGSPFRGFLQKHSASWLARAHDATFGGWANRMKGPQEIEYNSSWWIFAEADQFAATWNLLDFSQLSRLSQTTDFWLKHYVDVQHKGVYDGRKRDGAGWGWPASSTSKCNGWKNGYHATEHALLLYILGLHLEKKPIPLYFAVPPEKVSSFVPRAYLFQGRVIKREDLGDIGGGLHKVRVTFDQIY